MSNVRPGLIELYKNKIRYIGFTKENLDEKFDSKFLSQEEYDTLVKFYNEYSDNAEISSDIVKENDL